MDVTRQWGEYKGKKYVVAFMGLTKFGQRAKLQSDDGTKKFWVPADAVTLLIDLPSSGGPDDLVCTECGRGGHLVQDLKDGQLKHHDCCDIPPEVWETEMKARRPNDGPPCLPPPEPVDALSLLLTGVLLLTDATLAALHEAIGTELDIRYQAVEPAAKDNEPAPF